MTGLVKVAADPGWLNGVPDKYRDGLRELLEAATAPGTRRVYRGKLKLFLAWCQSEGLSALPAAPETVAAYVLALAQRGVSCSTVSLALAAISAAHRAAGLESPTTALIVSKAAKGYRRTHGVAVHKATAATGEIVKKMIWALMNADQKLRNLRDVALLSVGFAGAFRRSELVALDVEDLSWDMRDGREVVLATIRRSKTDQEGQGMTKAIFATEDAQSSPTLLLRRWLDAAGISAGPVFRRVRKGGQVQETRLDDQTVRAAIRRAASLAGLSMELSAHSLRSGFVTSAIRRGESERAIMNQTGHRSSAVMRGYYERENALEDNAGKNIW